jgi:hypothetical protein
MTQPVFPQPYQPYGIPPGGGKGVSGFGIAALVLGILALIVSWIPLCGMAALPLAAIGVILAIVGLIVSKTGGRSKLGMSVAGGILCLLAIGIQVAVTGGLMALGSKAAKQQADEIARQTAQAANATSVTAADLSAEFVADKAAASAKYKDKVLKITGKVQDPAGDGGRSDQLTLQGLPNPKSAADPMMMGGLFPANCYINNPVPKAARELTRGQEVTVLGTCSDVDALDRLTILNASVIKSGPDPAIVVSAVDLTKAFIDDESAATKKYTGQQVKVEGKVKSLNQKEYEVALEGAGSGDDAWSVVVRAGGVGWQIAKDFKVGQVVTVKGTAGGAYKNHIELSDTTRFVE